MGLSHMVEIGGFLDRTIVASTIVLSMLLVIFAAASLGRKLTDLEILQIRGLNGIRLLEIEVKIRAQANRILLALIFGALSALILADAPTEWRVWYYRVGVLVVLSVFTTSAVLDWFVDRKQLRMLVSEDFGKKEEHSNA